jgi:hypothetical protein
LATEPSTSVSNTILDTHSTAKNKKRKTDEDLSLDTLEALTRFNAKPSKWAKVYRLIYLEKSKKIYLTLKRLSMKKLKLASHNKVTTTMLKQGKLPYSIDFKGIPINAGGDHDYLTD